MIVGTISCRINLNEMLKINQFELIVLSGMKSPKRRMVDLNIGLDEANSKGRRALRRVSGALMRLCNIQPLLEYDM